MLTVSVMELVVCLSEVIDLMSEEIRDHHKRVACGAYQLAEACGISGETRRDIVLAAAVHDIGGLSLEARKAAVLHFEDTNSHAEKGYKLLSSFTPFQNVAHFVRYHHVQWNNGAHIPGEGQHVPLGSQIILMADRIAVMLQSGVQTLTQTKRIMERITRQSGGSFQPELVEALQQLASKDVFWLNITAQPFYDAIMEELKKDDILLSGTHLESMLDLISNIIDFRSSFTMMHSKGVAAVAEELAILMGLPANDCHEIRTAALLHDVGKLAIPTEILDKPGPLTEYERDIIRTHSYYTYRVLASLSGFSRIQKWASLHHECMNGQGYPFGFDASVLTLGSKIMKIADVFVALTEDRPYRRGLNSDQVFTILHTMAQKGEIDGQVLEKLSNNQERFTAICYDAEKKAAEQYKEFSEIDQPFAQAE